MTIISLLCWSSLPLSSMRLSAASFINHFWLANCPVGFPGGSDGKESACNAGDPGSIPGSGRSSREGIDYPLQYSWASLVAQMVKNLPACGRPGFDPWVGKIPWRRVWQSVPIFLPGESHGQRSLVGYSPWGRKQSGHD